MTIDTLKTSLNLKLEPCDDMASLRKEIDQLDRKIVEMLSIRKEYMDQAARIKQHRGLVRDNERVEDVVNKVKKHAKLTGANEKLVEKLYRDMIEWSIDYEFDRFDEIKE